MVQESHGHASALTKRIAAAGTHGRHRQNVARDIQRALDLPIEAWCNSNCKYPTQSQNIWKASLKHLIACTAQHATSKDIHYCKIPVLDDDRTTETEMLSPLLLPHEVYQFLYDSWLGYLRKDFCSGLMCGSA